METAFLTEKNAIAVKKYAKADINVLQSCPVLLFPDFVPNILSGIVSTHYRICVTEISLNVLGESHNCCSQLLKETNNYQLRDGKRLTVSRSHIFTQYVGLRTSQSNMQHHFWKQIFIRKLKLIFTLPSFLELCKVLIYFI